MKTLLPQGFSRSLLSFTRCGYIPYSRQNSLNLARRHPQGCPGTLHSSLHQGDGRKSRSAGCRGRSTRRERARGGLVPLPWTCEVSNALVYATETLGLDRIRIISISPRRTTSDWRRRDNGSVPFLRGVRRFTVTVVRSRQSSRLQWDERHPYRAQTRATQATEHPIYRQRCLRLTRSLELQSASSLWRETRSRCLTLVTPARLPRHCCLTEGETLFFQPSGASALDRANGTVLMRRTGRVSANIESHVLRTTVTHVAATLFPIQCDSKCTT